MNMNQTIFPHHPPSQGNNANFDCDKIKTQKF